MNNNVNRKNIFLESILFVSIFLFSLGSYYFYQIGFCVFQMIGVLMIAPIYRPHKITLAKSEFLLLLLFFIYIFLQGIIFLIFSDENSFEMSKLSLPFFVFSYFCFSAVIFCIHPFDSQRALRWVIFTHVGFFIFQFIWFFFTNDIIDFLAPFTGEDQRMLGGSYSLTYLPNFVRMTGLFNEPGTYSSWMILLLLLFNANKNRLGLVSENIILEISVIGTVLLSFSTFGFIFSIIYLIGRISEEKLNLKIIIIMTLAGAFFFYFGYEYFDSRFADGDGGINIRNDVLNLYFGEDLATNLSFGVGIFSNIFAKKGLVAQDVGLWFTILASGGLIGASFLLLFFKSSLRFRLWDMILLMVVMLSKFSLTQAFVWVIFFFFLMQKLKVVSSVSVSLRQVEKL